MKVTIKVERADGQFTVAQTEVPDTADDDQAMRVGYKILYGFIDAYRRAIDLPE